MRDVVRAELVKGLGDLKGELQEVRGIKQVKATA